jgi:hypothetical protein
MQPQTTQEKPHCENPFFSCVNIDPELKIVLDIQLKEEKYEICQYCWPLIAESEEYTWTTQKTEEQEKTLEPNWNTTKTTNPEETED